MKCDRPSNIPRTLEEQLRAGKVIPFVGAGVSMAVRNKDTGGRLFPSWKELLLKAADRLEAEQKQSDANLVRTLLAIDTPDYLYAAKHARKSLGAAIWYNFLKECLDFPRSIVDDNSLSLAQAVWELGSKLIITTNYDRVLKWSSSDQGDLRLWDIEAPAEQVEALSGRLNQSTVWHLHGHIDNKANLILTPDGYSRLYPEAGGIDVRYEAALKTIHTFLTSHTFVFIGFSLDDEYFSMQLRGISDIFQGASGPHYVLVREAESEKVKSLNLRVEIITFKDFGEPLNDLLHSMAAVTASKTTEDKTTHLRTKCTPVVNAPAPFDPGNPVFYVPFREKGDMVVGREDALNAVRTQLMSGKPTAIGQTAAFEGLGGLGKTQLAVEYAYKYRAEYPNGVIWINADQDIDAQLINIADEACWIAPETEHKYKLDIAKQRLKSYSNCLIIFDNLEDIEKIRAYLPLNEVKTHIIVTSRTEQPGFVPVPIELLSKELSLKMLYQEAGRTPLGDEEEKAAEDIALALAGLPLAIELAGAYLQYRHTVGFRDYRDLLNQSLKNALQKKFTQDGFTKHDTDLYSTLKINEKVFVEEPRLREIIDLLTWSGAAPMGLSLMCALLDASNPIALTNALSLGTTLHLLRKESGRESYAIHRLVQEVRREDIPLEQQTDWVDTVCKSIGDWFKGKREEFSLLPLYEAEIEHLVAWQANAAMFAPGHASRLLWLQFYPPYHRGDYKKAMDLVEKAILLFEKQNEDRELHADLLNDLGLVCGYCGNFEDELKNHEAALKIRQELFGERDRDTARSLNNVGSAYGDMGDHRKELEYCEMALKIFKDLLGEAHQDTATALNNVGFAYRQMGDRHKALEYYSNALEIQKKLFGERHPDTATSLNNAGAVYGKMGDHHKALEYYNKALKIRKDLFGERHPDTANSLNSIGVAYGGMGDHRKELEYCNQALGILKDLFGESHPNTARTMSNVGFAYGQIGDHRKELEYFGKALETRKGLLGNQHPDTLTSVCNIASTLINLNQKPRAAELLNSYLRGLPQTHPAYQKLLDVRARIPGFRKTGNKKKKR